MAFSQFIIENIDEIVSEWENFAKTMRAAARLDPAALRGEASQILRAIAHDMKQSRTSQAREAKSKGEVVRAFGAPDTAAESHGGARFGSGCNVNEIVAEFRAVRASVMRLWTRQLLTVDGDALYDLMRFNEGMDQALGESVERYTAMCNLSLNRFLATG